MDKHMSFSEWHEILFRTSVYFELIFVDINDPNLRTEMRLSLLKNSTFNSITAVRGNETLYFLACSVLHSFFSGFANKVTAGHLLVSRSRAFHPPSLVRYLGSISNCLINPFTSYCTYLLFSTHTHTYIYIYILVSNNGSAYSCYIHHGERRMGIYSNK